MKKSDKTLDEIEETQFMLRESIQRARVLTDKFGKLLTRHRREVKEEA